MESPPAQARLFTLRVWPVTGDAAPEWRARLQNVQSGEVTFCADWDALIACLEESLRDDDNAPATSCAA